MDRKDSFVITDNYFLATDWENRKYKFDFDGQSFYNNNINAGQMDNWTRERKTVPNSTLPKAGAESLKKH